MDQPRTRVQIRITVLGALLALACSCAPAIQTGAVATHQSAEPETVSLPPSRDVTLIESATGALANGQGSGLFVGRTVQPEGSHRRTLIAFAVEGSLPRGSRVISATLSLALSHTRSKPQPIELRRPLARWAEGSSRTPGGRGAPSEIGDVTWLARSHPDDAWREPGGDFDEVVVAVTTTAPEGERTTWGPTEALTADVQKWLDRPQENRGWLLLGNEREPGTAMHFASREHEDQDLRPRLTVTFRPPG